MKILEMKEKGIGSELIKKAIEIAKIMSYKIIATSRFERKKVHNFYKKLGFRKWGYEFIIDLE